ncbi:MAG: hypothetical protein ACRD7E_31880 [Bryobacteraceae bacterium]
MLFDLKNDGSERRDLAYRHPEKVSELRTLMPIHQMNVRSTSGSSPRRRGRISIPSSFLPEEGIVPVAASTEEVKSIVIVGWVETLPAYPSRTTSLHNARPEERP